MKKQIFTLLTLLLCVSSGAWAADSECTYTQPTATLDLASSDLGTTLAGIAWTGSNLSTGYKLSDQYLELPVLPLAATSISWRVQENGSTNATGVDWSASGIFSAYSAFYSKSGQNNCIKSRTTRYVAVKVTSCKAAYVYGAANVSVNVYTVGDGQGTAKINTLTLAGSATTTAIEVKSVTGLDPAKTYIVQIAGSTGSNANAYAMILERDLTPRTGTTVNTAVSDQTFIANGGNTEETLSNTGIATVTFTGIGTLTGTNMQGPGSNLTVSGKTYSSIKGAKGATYVLNPADGITISAVQLYTTSNNGSATCKITTGGVTTETVNSESRTTPTSIALAKNASDKFEFTVSSESDYSQNLFVLVITYDKVENVDVKVSSAGYATLYYNKNLVVPAGVKAYKAAVSGSNIALTDIGDLIPANKGVILEAAEGTHNFLTTTADASAVDVSGNILTGTTSATTKEALGGTVYTLGQDALGVVGLRNFTGTDIRAYSAYSTSISLARDFYAFDTDVTAINKVEAKKVENGVFYNLAGQQVAQPTKGLYIVNGKKVIIK